MFEHILVFRFGTLFVEYCSKMMVFIINSQYFGIIESIHLWPQYSNLFDQIILGLIFFSLKPLCTVLIDIHTPVYPI